MYLYNIIHTYCNYVHMFFIFLSKYFIRPLPMPSVIKYFLNTYYTVDNMFNASVFSLV